MDEAARAKHAAYMREYLADPEKRDRRNARRRELYKEQRQAMPRQRRRWTDQEILDAIRGLAIDGVATCPGNGSLGTLAGRRFGSWSAACRAAGVISGRDRPLRADAKYSTVHSRLNSERGQPERCEVCGVEGPSRRYEWAFRLDVPAVLFNEKGHPYSVRLDDYQRLCKSCHVQQDARR